MNGGETAQLVEYARRSHEAAQRAADSALRAEQSFTRLEREIEEMRRDMRHGFEALNAALQVPRQAHRSLTEEDWEDSPTGTHKMVSRRTFESWAKEREMSADARRWRKVLRVGLKALGFVLAIVVGWLIRHFMGKP